MRAIMTPTMKSAMPPSNECRSEKIAPPDMSATKNSLPLRAQDGQRAVHCFVNFVLP